MAETREYYRQSRSEMACFLPAEYSTVLEIGCAEGDFVKYLKSGCEVWGVEPDSTSAATASEKLTKVLVGTFEAVQEQIPQRYFDVVVCNDVIEHVEDVGRFLGAIREKLRPGGFLVASVPNVRHIRNLYELLILKDWRYRESGILDRTHRWFFTRKSLLRTLTESGFIVEEMRGINSTRHPARRIALLAVVVATFGYYADVRFMQFGVRARKN